MAKEQLKELVKQAESKDLSKFRKGLKEVLRRKITKRLDEKEQEISKSLFQNGKKGS